MKQNKANGHAMPVKSDGVTKLQSDESPVHTDQIIRQKGTVNIPLMYGKGTKGVPLVYGECTGGVLKRYCKGTTNVLRRYWKGTKDLLSVGTPRVPRYRTDRQSVGHDRTRVQGGYYTASASVGALFDCCSTVLRQLFDYESKRCRSGLEEQSKPTRSGLEQESNKSRSDVEEIGLSQGFWYRTSARLDADIRRDIPAYLPLQIRCAPTVLLMIFFVFHPFVCFQRMMKNKAIRICVYGFVSLLFNNAALAQSHENGGAVDGVVEIRPLQIGDTVPEELWNLPLQVINHPDGKDTITLNDYRDKKLIILDFWATWCGSCYDGLDSLSVWEGSHETVQGLAVSNQSRDIVRKTFTDRGWQHIGVVDVNDLHEYFQHRLLPHQVLIRDNRVYSTSSGYELTQEKVALLVDGVEVPFTEKRDNISFQPAHSLLSVADLDSFAGLASSVSLHTYIPGLGNRSFMTKTDSHTKMTLINKSIAHLYYTLASASIKHKIVYDFSNTEHIIPPAGLSNAETEAWYIKNAMGFEMISNSQSDDMTIKAKALKYLNSFLNHSGEMEMVELETYFIVDSDSVENAEISGFLGKNKKEISFKMLLDNINVRIPSDPLDKKPIRYTNKSSFDMERIINVSEGFGYREPQKLQEILAEYGLSMVLGKELHECYVIRSMEKGGSDVR